MQETPHQYVSRLVGYVRNRDPLRSLDASARKIESLARRIPLKQYNRSIARGKWSPAKIVAHLAEMEMVYAYRFRMILSVNGTPIQLVDEGAWAENAGYLLKDRNAALAVFRALRKANLALLKSIPKAMWKQHGYHAQRGKETVERIAMLMAGHDINHMRQIEPLAK